MSFPPPALALFLNARGILLPQSLCTSFHSARRGLSSPSSPLGPDLPLQTVRPPLSQGIFHQLTDLMFYLLWRLSCVSLTGTGTPRCKDFPEATLAPGPQEAMGAYLYDHVRCPCLTSKTRCGNHHHHPIPVAVPWGTEPRSRSFTAH